jgi:transcriptional regulator with PAS, ATPase and Fis domain
MSTKLVRFLTKQLKYPEAFSNIITQNDSMFSIFNYIESIAPTMHPVFITGETGVGKGLLAEAIHSLSLRKGPFIHVNVSGIDANMFTDTLFGHIKGAFTGATKERTGLCEEASTGTLFLDEIGDLDNLSQIKLLNLFQERKYYPIGQDQPSHCQARFITATNCDIDRLVEKNVFRKDLFFRLNTHRIHLPPLRERIDDLPVLVDYFLKQGAQNLNKKKPSVYKEMIQLLNSYSFPGNIRELKAMVDDALCRHQSHTLSLTSFKAHLNRKNRQNYSNSDIQKIFKDLFNYFDDLPTIKEATEQLINEALKRANGNLSIAAPILGISRQALGKRLKRKEEKK